PADRRRPACVPGGGPGGGRHRGAAHRRTGGARAGDLLPDADAGFRPDGLGPGLPVDQLRGRNRGRERDPPGGARLAPGAGPERLAGAADGGTLLRRRAHRRRTCFRRPDRYHALTLRPRPGVHPGERWTDARSRLSDLPLPLGRLRHRGGLRRPGRRHYGALQRLRQPQPALLAYLRPGPDRGHRGRHAKPAGGGAGRLLRHHRPARDLLLHRALAAAARRRLHRGGPLPARRPHQPRPAGLARARRLEARQISVRFGALAALASVSLDVQSGERRALIGPNGAGKTTLFNVIAGELRPASGSVLLDGRDVTSLPTWRRARMSVGRTFQRSALFPRLSVGQNLELAVRRGALGGRRRAVPDRLAAAGLSAVAERPAVSLG